MILSTAICIIPGAEIPANCDPSFFALGIRFWCLFLGVELEDIRNICYTEIWKAHLHGWTFVLAYRCHKPVPTRQLSVGPERIYCRPPMPRKTATSETLSHERPWARSLMDVYYPDWLSRPSIETRPPHRHLTARVDFPTP